MTDIVKGMVPAYNNAWTHIPEFDEIEVGQLKAMRAALLWLAANVSDEMVRSASADRAKDDEGQFQALEDLIDFSGENKTRTVIKSAISAAIRAAAGEEGK